MMALGPRAMWTSRHPVGVVGWLLAAQLGVCACGPAEPDARRGQPEGHGDPAHVAEQLAARGFVVQAVMRTDPAQGFAIDHADNAIDGPVIYVAIGRGVVVYVGQARSFRRRYGGDHVRWLRGEKGTSERQRQRWVDELAAGAVTFYARSVPEHQLDHEERRLIGELRPRLNVTHNPRAAEGD